MVGHLRYSPILFNRRLVRIIIVAVKSSRRRAVICFCFKHLLMTLCLAPMPFVIHVTNYDRLFWRYVVAFYLISSKMPFSKRLIINSAQKMLRSYDCIKSWSFWRVRKATKRKSVEADESSKVGLHLFYCCSSQLLQFLSLKLYLQLFQCSKG